MARIRELEKRISQIGEGLSLSTKALALLALGSIGAERDRMDDWSDLDFYVISRKGRKGELLAELSWLSRDCPLAFTFANTPDGFKALFEDGIYCEFAVFEADELERSPMAEGRIVWSAPGFTLHAGARNLPGPWWKDKTVNWSLNEALTLLYVGLCRFRRGEKLSAFRFVQNFAVDRVMELADKREVPAAGFPDPFTLDRRFEFRFPESAKGLSPMMQGIERSPESALAILSWLRESYPVNEAMSAEIERLAAIL
jgi:hypothetical protein